MRKIYKNIIIGSGFSAFVLSKFLKKDYLVVSSNSSFIKHYPRRKNLKNLKLFSPKFESRGKIRFLLKNSILHDSLIQGGNTNFWGGVCNLKKIKRKINLLKNFVSFKRLNINETGNFSNKNQIHQMQRIGSKSGEIFNCSNYFEKILKGHLINFKVLKKNLIKIKIKDKKNKTLLCKNLVLAVNFTQLIEILVNSNIIKDKDFFFLNEYDFNTKISFFKSKKYSVTENKLTILGYSISGIIKHATGIQQNFNKILFTLLNLIPFYYYQIFKDQINKAKYIYHKKNFLIEEIETETHKGFGRSVHYFNLKINNLQIKDKLRLINKNIYGISSPFITNSSPGPISNDLIDNAHKIANILNKK